MHFVKCRLMRAAATAAQGVCMRGAFGKLLGSELLICGTVSAIVNMRR